MRVALVGGIFGKDSAYQAAITSAPEITLADGLAKRGHQVVRLGHDDRLPDDVEIIHIHHFGSALLRAKMVSRTPIVFTLHGSVNHPPIARRMTIATRVSDAFVALTPEEQSLLEERNVRSVFIPNAVDPEIFFPEVHKVRGEHLRILFVGQRTRAKGYVTLLNALSRTNDLLTVISHVEVGRETDELNRLESSLNLGGRITHLWRQPPAVVAEEMRRADVLVLPSFHEALPTVVTEGLFCGLPIVATDLQGIRWQLDGRGLLIEPGSTDGLELALAKLRDNYETFRREATNYVQVARTRFAVDSMVEAHARLYDELLQTTSARSLHGPVVRSGLAATDTAVRAILRLMRHARRAAGQVRLPR
ncbi:MAG: glycosyltransferase family 4 protein [Acidimicrobiia bacterium]